MICDLNKQKIIAVKAKNGPNAITSKLSFLIIRFNNIKIVPLIDPNKMVIQTPTGPIADPINAASSTSPSPMPS